MLRTPGGAVVLNSAIQTAGGDLTIGADTVADRVGSVSFTNTALAAPAVTLRAGGDIEVYANDALTLRGTAAGGAVTLDTRGRLTNSNNSILAATGVVLVAGGDAGDGVELREIRDGSALRPSVQVSGAGDVTLDTGGAVSIGGGIRTTGGDINIGATIAAASVTLLPGAVLQTFAGATPAGAIDINATGAISARSSTNERIGLIARDITLESAGGDITVDELLGLKNADTFTGIGSLSATTAGAGSVRVREAEIKAGSGGIALTAGTGGIHFDAARASSVLAVGGTGGVTLRTPGGVVDLDGGITTGAGNIGIGEVGNAVASVQMAAGTQLRTQTGDVNIQVGSGSSTIGSIVGNRAGGDGATVTIRSDGAVEMLGAIGAPALEDEDDPQPRLDTPLFVDIDAASIVFRGAETSGAGGVRLVVDAGGRVDLYGQIWSHGGGIVIGRPTAANSNATINLSHNLLTDGQTIDLNGNVILFDGVGRWGFDTPFGLEDALRSVAGDEAYFLTQVFRPRARGINDPGIQEFFFGATPPTPQYGHDPRDLCMVRANCNVDPDQPQADFRDLMRFIGSSNSTSDYDLRAFDSRGVLDSSPSGTGTCAMWICGYRTADALSIDGPGGLLAQAIERERRFQNLLGSLSVRIDTNASGAAAGGSNVNVSGSLRRYVAEGLDNRPAAVLIPDGYVNHELVISLGTGTFTVSGPFGDSLQESTRTSSAADHVATALSVGDPLRLDTTDVGMPDLGLFDVVVESGTLSIPVPQDLNDPEQQRYVNSITVAVVGLTQTPFDYQFPVAWTDKSNGPLLDNQGPPGSAPFVPPVIGNPLDGGSNGINGSGTSAGAALAGNGSTNNDTSGGTLGSSIGGTGTDPSQPLGPIDFGLPSTSDSQQREDESDDEDSEHQSPPVQTEGKDEDQCPRGAGQEADLGVSRSVDGAASDVFAKCPDG